MLVVFSLRSSPTVDTENRAKRLQPTLPFPVPVEFPFNLQNAVYKMPNKRILDLEHQRQQLTTR